MVFLVEKYLNKQKDYENFPKKSEEENSILNSFNQYLYKKYQYESLNQSLLIPLKTNKNPEILFNNQTSMSSIIINEDGTATLKDYSVRPSIIKNNTLSPQLPNNVQTNQSTRNSFKMSLQKPSKKEISLKTSTMIKKSNTKIDETNKKSNPSLSRCFTTNKCIKLLKNY